MECHDAILPESTVLTLFGLFDWLEGLNPLGQQFDRLLVLMERRQLRHLARTTNFHAVQQDRAFQLTGSDQARLGHIKLVVHRLHIDDVHFLKRRTETQFDL